VLLARQRAPRLAWTGGILLGLGLCGLMAVQGFETLQFALVRDGRFDLSQPLIGHVIALVGALWIASTILRAREEPA
jgi:hypothetical protein